VLWQMQASRIEEGCGRRRPRTRMARMRAMLDGREGDSRPFASFYLAALSRS
jgi:hypothetical protein